MHRISMDQGAAHSLSASMHESSTSRGRSLDAGGPAAAAAEVPTRPCSPTPAASNHSMPMHELHAAGHEASSMMLGGPPQADPYHHTPAATFGNHTAGAGPAATLSQPYNAHAHRTAPPLGVPPRTAAGRASAAVAGFRPLASSPPDSWAHHPSMGGAMLHHAPDHPTPGLELRAPQNPDGPWGGGPFTSGGPFNSHGPQQYGQYAQQQQQQARPLGPSFHGGRSGSMGGAGTGGQMAAGAGGSASFGGAGKAQESAAGGSGGGSGGGGGGGGDAPRLDARLVVDHPVATRVTQRPDGTIVCEPVEVLMWNGHSRKNGEDSSPRALHHQMSSQAEQEEEQGGLHPLLARAHALWRHPQFQEAMGISAVVLGAVCGLAGLGGAAITLATAVGGSKPALPLPSLHSGPSTFHSHGVTISFGGTNSSSPSHKQSSSRSNPRSSPPSSSSSSRSSRTDPINSGSKSGYGSASGTGGASAAAGSGGGMGGRSGNRLRMGHVADAGHNAMMCSASVLVALASGMVVAPVVAAVHLTRLLLRPALLVGGVAAGVRWARRVRVGATQLLRKLQSGDLRRQLEALRLIVHRAATSPAFRREWARLHGVEALLAYLSAALAAAQAAAAAAQATSGTAPGAFPPLLPPGLYLAPSATTSPGSTLTHPSFYGTSFTSDLNSGSSYSYNSSGSSGYNGSGGSSRYYGSGSTTTATSAEAASAAAVAAVWGVGAASGLLVGSLAGPGPALAVRALGELTRDRAAVDALVACGGIPLLYTAAGTALYGSPTAAAAVGAAVGAAVAAGTTTAGMAAGAMGGAAGGAPGSARGPLPGQQLAARFGVAAAAEGIAGHQLHSSVTHHRPGSPASVKDGSGEETGGDEEGGDSWTVVSPTKTILGVARGGTAVGPAATAAAATAATAAAAAAGAGGEANGPGQEAKGPGGDVKGPGAATAAAADAGSSVAGEQPSSRASEPAAAHTDPSNNPTTPPRPSKPHPADSATTATAANPATAATAVAALRSAAVASRAGCVPALVTAVVEVLARSSAQSSEAARMIASLPGCAALAVDLLQCALSATGSTAGGFSAPFDGAVPAPATASNVPMAAASAAVPALALLNAIALQPAGKAAMGAAGGVGVLASALCAFAPPSARVSLDSPHPCGADERKKHGASGSGGGGKVPGGAHASKHGGAAGAGGAAATVETGRNGSSALWEPSLFASAASALHGCVRGDPSNTRALAALAAQPTALHSALARATAALARAHAAGDVWSPAPSSLLSLPPPPSSPSPSVGARRAIGRAAAAAAVAAAGSKKGVFGSSSGKRYVSAGHGSSCLVVGEESEEEEVGGGLPSLRSLAMDVAALAHLVSPGGQSYGL